MAAAISRSYQWKSAGLPSRDDCCAFRRRSGEAAKAAEGRLRKPSLRSQELFGSTACRIREVSRSLTALPRCLGRLVTLVLEGPCWIDPAEERAPVARAAVVHPLGLPVAQRAAMDKAPVARAAVFHPPWQT